MVRESMALGVEENPLLLHFALYVRDVYSLLVPGDIENPPRLRGSFSGRSNEILDSERRVVSEQWLRWWKELVAKVGATHVALLKFSTSGKNVLWTNGISRSEEIDFPNFESLRAMPELRRVVISIADEGSQWEIARVRRVTSDPIELEHRALEREIFRSVVESFSPPGSVRLGSVRAAILLLDVDGEWAYSPSTDVVVCSREFLRDKPRFGSLLAEVLRLNTNDYQLKESVHSDHFNQDSPTSESLLAAPAVLGHGDGVMLTVDSVDRFPDGLEIRISRSGAEREATCAAGQSNSASKTRDPFGRTDRFLGLEVGLRFPNGGTLMTQVWMEESDESDQVIRRFWRSETDESVLWLWTNISPLEGPVIITCHWACFGIDGSLAVLD